MSGALRAEGLVKRFRGSAVPALDGVGLAVEGGRCTAVLGPSGSGKSTLLRLVAGLERPDAGTVSRDGEDLADVAPERRRMAMVAQRPLLLPHLGALDAIAFSARARGARRAPARSDAMRFLELVGLAGLGDRRPHELSGGQQQRVALARALAARPAVLLLDEPFSALDAELRQGMHDLLRRIREEAAPTVLLVTHDRDEAAALADRIVLLDRGRVLQDGTPDELYERPRSIAVFRAMGGRNELPGTVEHGVHRSPWGGFTAPGLPDGPAVAVVRQERVALGPDGIGAAAHVVAVRRAGPRSLVVLQGDGGLVHAESTDAWTIGARARVRIAASDVHVLPPEAADA